METESEQQAEEAARDILSRGVHSVLVKRGTNGSLLIDRLGDAKLQPIFQVEKVCSEPGIPGALRLKIPCRFVAKVQGPPCWSILWFCLMCKGGMHCGAGSGHHRSW